MSEHIVILRVTLDDDDLEWWRAMGLPDPVYWPERASWPHEVFPETVLERRLA